MQANIFFENKKKILLYLQYCSQSRYYHDLFIKNNIDINKISTYDDFKCIPKLKKSIYRDNLFDILSPRYASMIDKNTFLSFGDDYVKKKKYLLDQGLYIKVTSGSTGTPLEIIKSNDDINRDYILLNRLRKKFLGQLPKGKFVWIWPVTQYVSNHFYFDNDSNFYQVNQYGFQYFIVEMSDSSFEKLYLFIIENNISWVTCTPTFIYNFATYLAENDLTLSLEYIECHSEKLFLWQIDFINQVFHTTPCSIYSTNEVQFIGMTCKNKQMHIHRNVFLEVCKDENGNDEVLITSLNNFDTPFLRYQIGDRGKWNIKDCLCEFSNYPILNISEYRTNDYVTDETGKKYEPYIITDSIILASSYLGIKISQYKVCQVHYLKFIYYIDYLFNKQLRQQFQIYLEKYFTDIFKSKKVVIEIRDYKELDTKNVNKHKYFENMVI